MKRMQTAQWWRVVVDAEGNVSSCRPVEAAGADDGGGVFYVQALTSPQAGKEAAAQYAKAVRHKHKTLGLCVCGGKRVQDFASCAECRKRHTFSNATRSAKLKGLPAPERQSKKPIAAPQSTAPTKINTRLAVLLEVQSAWLNNGTLGQFSKWLNSQIAALQDKKSA